MANFEQRENSGTLFVNKKKTPGTRQPDYNGTINVKGEELEISAWVRQGRSGDFFSLSVKEKWTPSNRDNGPDHDPDIPF